MFWYGLSTCLHLEGQPLVGFRRDRMVAPSTTIVFLEAAEDNFGESNGQFLTIVPSPGHGIGARHSGGANFVMGDGHVEWITFAAFCRKVMRMPRAAEQHRVGFEWTQRRLEKRHSISLVVLPLREYERQLTRVVRGYGAQFPPHNEFSKLTQAGILGKDEGREMKRILGLVTVLAVVGLGMNAVAGPFGAGNIVLVRVGDGTQSISNIGNSVFLDEYTTNAYLGGRGQFYASSPVQSIAMPTNWVGRNAPLIMEGSARPDGALSLSTDGRFLLLAGFAPTIGLTVTQAIDTTTTTGLVNQVARVVGLVDGNGHIYTTTTLIDANEDGNDIQSAVSLDGTNIWHVGEGNATGGKYTTQGSMTSTQVETVSRFNSRVFNIYNKTLYYSANHVVGAPTNTSAAVNPFGGALPTSFVNSNFLNLAGGARQYCYKFTRHWQPVWVRSV